MLYDVFPPLIFFTSLAGLLVVVGRVMVRLKRGARAETILRGLHESSTGSFDPAHVLRPARQGIRLIRSRASYLAAILESLPRRVATRVGAIRAQLNRSRLRDQTRAWTEAATTVQASLITSNRLGRFQRMAQAVGQLRATVKNARGAPWQWWRRPPLERASAAPAATTAAVAGPPADTSILAGTGAERTDTIHTRRVDGPPALDASAVQAAVVTGRRRGRKSVPAPGMKALQEAEAAIAKEAYEQGESILVPYIVDHPRDTEAYMLLGRCALGRCAWHEAIEIFDQILRWRRDDPTAQAGLGYAAFRAGQYTRALQSLQRAHDANPADREVLECLLSIARKLDNVPLERSLLRELTDVDRPLA